MGHVLVGPESIDVMEELRFGDVYDLADWQVYTTRQIEQAVCRV